MPPLKNLLEKIRVQKQHIEMSKVHILAINDFDNGFSPVLQVILTNTLIKSEKLDTQSAIHGEKAQFLYNPNQVQNDERST